MIKKCEQCNKEYEAKTTRSKYCSDLCKLHKNRIVSRSVSVNDTSVSKDLTDMTTLNKKEFSLEEVCNSNDIAEFPQMCETKRQMAESIYVLENNDDEVLKIHGIFIPNWRKTRRLYNES